MGDRRESKPVSLGAALRSMVGSLDSRGKLAEARVRDAWLDVVGERIGSHATASGMRGPELIVLVDSAAWANELTYMAEDLRVRINSAVGQELVASIRFTVSSGVEKQRAEEQATADAERRYGGARVQPVPLTDAERAAVEKSVSVIEDDALRDAALRATVRDLEWKKGLDAPKSPQSEPEGPRGPDLGDLP